MNAACGREWSRQFIRKTFSQVFINKTLKEHREIVLFDQERAMLPATQPLVERQIHREQLNTEYNELRRQMNELRRQSSDVLRRQYRLEHGESAALPERAAFVRACPDATCRGYLSSQWKCGLCEQWTCNVCHEIKGLNRDVEHTCDPNNVATADLLNRDTKPCPSCGMGIFRIEGCSQMYCTACNTAFDWRTAQIVTTAIHNPHYFEYLQRTGHAEGTPLAAQQHPCGRDINHQFVRRNYELMSAKLEPRGISQNTVHRQYRVHVDKFCSIARGVIHVRLVELPQYRYNHAQNNETLRIQFMRNLITEEFFKRKLQMQNKKHQKNLEISQVCQMVINTVTDILYRFQQEIHETDWNGLPQDQDNDPFSLQDTLSNETGRSPELLATNAFKTLDEVDRIIDYANECLRDISTTYDSVKLQFNDKFELR